MFANTSDDSEVVESEVVAPTTADGAETSPSDRSAADPTPDSVTAPGSTAGRPQGEGAVTPRDMEEQDQDYVEDQAGSVKTLIWRRPFPARVASR
jgi:hypothetical protein